MTFSTRHKYRDAFSRVCHFRFRKRWFEVFGESMAPTLHHGQLVILDLTYYNRNQYYIQHGDIVAFKNHYNPEEIFIKRIIGLPHEVVRLEGKQIFVNDFLLQDFSLPNTGPYVSTPRSWYLDANEYFLLGDNTANSLYSRQLGTIHSKYILGLIWFRLWPPTLL